MDWKQTLINVTMLTQESLKGYIFDSTLEEEI